MQRRCNSDITVTNARSANKQRRLESDAIFISAGTDKRDLVKQLARGRRGRKNSSFTSFEIWNADDVHLWQRKRYFE